MANRFELFIYTDNAAFEEDAGAEIARILRAAADDVESGVLYRDLRDINGNPVGKFNREA